MTEQRNPDKGQPPYRNPQAPPIKNTDLAMAVRRAIVSDQLKLVRKAEADRLALKPEDEPKALTRWQRVRAVFAEYWAIAKQRLKGEPR